MPRQVNLQPNLACSDCGGPAEVILIWTAGSDVLYLCGACHMRLLTLAILDGAQTPEERVQTIANLIASTPEAVIDAMTGLRGEPVS